MEGAWRPDADRSRKGRLRQPGYQIGSRAREERRCRDRIPARRTLLPHGVRAGGEKRHFTLPLREGRKRLLRFPPTPRLRRVSCTSWSAVALAKADREGAHPMVFGVSVFNITG